MSNINVKLLYTSEDICYTTANISLPKISIKFSILKNINQCNLSHTSYFHCILAVVEIGIFIIIPKSYYVKVQD